MDSHDLGSCQTYAPNLNLISFVSRGIIFKSCIILLANVG